MSELLADVFDADRSLDASGLCAGLMVGYLAGVGLGVMVDFVFFFGQGHHLITPPESGLRCAAVIGEVRSPPFARKRFGGQAASPPKPSA